MGLKKTTNWSDHCDFEMCFIIVCILYSHTEVASRCEDESKEESLMEKIPITGKSNGCIIASNAGFDFII